MSDVERQSLGGRDFAKPSPSPARTMPEKRREIMNVLRWLDRNIENVIGVALFIVMTAFLTYQVSSRYILNLSLAWTEELSMYCLIWVCYMGASAAVRERKHLRITMAFEWCSPKTRKIVDILSNIVSCGFCFFLLIGTTEMLALILQGNQVSAGSGLPKWIPNLGLPIAFGLMVIRFIQDTAQLVREYKELP